MSHQYATLEDTVYFGFASNDTSGSGGDGATPLFDVREAGAAASAIPLLSGTPTLLTHVNFPPGCYEVAVAATAANGFAAGDVFLVYCTLAIDSQNPSGFIGSCKLTPLATAAAVATVDANVDTLLDALVLNVTTIATLASQTSFTLTAGSTDDAAYEGATIVVVDQSTGVQKAFGSLSAYTGSSKTVTLAQDPGIFTMATGDIVYILPSDVFAIWDRVLSGSKHNIMNSAGKRLRQIDAAFEVHSGTAQAGTSTTITLDTGASATDEIYDGDRCIIVGGTGAEEHGLIKSYDGTTKVATMSKAWTITPDATSEFVLVPADVDVELWNDNTVTGDGDWAAVQADLDIITGATGVNLLTATQSTIDNINSGVGIIIQDTNELQTDWTDGGRLDLLLDAIPTTAMRGTDSAALASVATEARLAELDPANMPADLANTLIDTGTTLPGILGTPAGADMTADIAGVKADTTIPQRNQAFSNIPIIMVDSTDHVTPKTGLTVTGARSIDGGAEAAVSGAIAEVSNGRYSFDGLAADLNGAVINFRFSAAGADDAFLTIITRPA